MDGFMKTKRYRKDTRTRKEGKKWCKGAIKAFGRMVRKMREWDIAILKQRTYL